LSEDDSSEQASRGERMIVRGAGLTSRAHTGEEPSIVPSSIRVGKISPLRNSRVGPVKKPP